MQNTILFVHHTERRLFTAYNPINSPSKIIVTVAAIPTATIGLIPLESLPRGGSAFGMSTRYDIIDTSEEILSDWLCRFLLPFVPWRSQID